MKKRICTLLAIGLFSSFAFVISAQQNNEQIPQGRWVFKSIAVFENNEQVPTNNLRKIDFEIPVEVDVKSAEVMLADEGGMKYKAVVYGNLLCFHVCAEWSVADGILQLQWVQVPKEGERGNEKTIIVQYSRYIVKF